MKNRQGASQPIYFKLKINFGNEVAGARSHDPRAEASISQQNTLEVCPCLPNRN